MNTDKNLAALRWACRRGMLELDLLFSQFLDKGYPQLSLEEQALFKEFLLCTDPELFAWLMGSAVPDNPLWLPLIQKIKEYVPCRSA
jgi:antitoxin CptB